MMLLPNEVMERWRKVITPDGRMVLTVEEASKQRDEAIQRLRDVELAFYRMRHMLGYPEDDDSVADCVGNLEDMFEKGFEWLPWPY